MDEGRSGPLAALERALRDRLGIDPDRASVSYLGVEPIEVLRFRPAGRPVRYVTLGMSRQPMASTGQRAELTTQAWVDQGQLWRRLALLAAAPTVESATFAVDSTVDVGEPLDHGSRCTGAVVGGWDAEPLPVRGPPITVLELLPATATELAWARVHGVPALRRRWVEQHVDLADLARRAVDLTG